MILIFMFIMSIGAFSFRNPTTSKASVLLNANKSRTNNVGKAKSASGFGGAAARECPCGSGLSYMNCCSKIHRDPKAFSRASPEQVVRARYSAYALREIDFIISSTHPLNKDFLVDIEHWKKQIRLNCYDNFKLTQCRILEEKFQDEDVAIVKFVAHMIQIDLNEKTSFAETSTFERLSKTLQGPWLYKSGIVEPSPE